MNEFTLNEIQTSNQHVEVYFLSKLAEIHDNNDIKDLKYIHGS